MTMRITKGVFDAVKRESQRAGLDARTASTWLGPLRCARLEDDGKDSRPTAVLAVPNEAWLLDLPDRVRVAAVMDDGILA